MNNEFIKYIATVLVTIVISMTGFWMMMGRNYVTRAETKVIAAEKMVIVEERLEMYLGREDKLEALINMNTKAINEFRVQTAILNQTLQHMQNQMEEKDRNVKE